VASRKQGPDAGIGWDERPDFCYARQPQAARRSVPVRLCHVIPLSLKACTTRWSSSALRRGLGWRDEIERARGISGV
jgi:hypothetical protein